MVVRLLLLILLAASLPSAGQTPAKGSAEYWLEKGEAALARQEYITAHAHLNECLRVNPKLAEGYRVRAIIREHLGEKAKALTDYNIYMGLQPDDAEALFSRGTLRYETGQYALARQDFLSVLRAPRGPTNTVYYSQEKYAQGTNKIFTQQTREKDHVYHYLGLTETKLKQYDHAIAWLDSAVRTAPNNAAYYVSRGVAKAALADKNGARDDYEKALELDPGNSLALHNLAALKSSMGEADESEALLSEAIAQDKNLPYPRAERAWQRFQKGDFKGALEDYNEVIKLEPRDADNYLNRGLVKEKLKDVHGALLDFTKAVELDEKNAKAWLSRGNTLSKTGRVAEAIEDYTVALKLDPAYGLAFYNRAISYHAVGKAAEACSDLSASIKYGIKPDERVKAKICP